MPDNVTQLRTRKPTGRPGWPRILLSGAEGTWKSGTAALLSADDRLGTMFWVEIGLGEQTADEYGSLPGVDYEIVDHDGTWLDMYQQLGAAWQVAKDAEEAGEPPRPLTIDAMSGIHAMLMELGDNRARKRAAAKIAKSNGNSAVVWSADYESNMSSDLWNLIRKRHGQLMKYILTWPGPVVLISRERMATVFENDKPTTQKDWTLECRKDLPSDVTAWVRLFGGGRAEILKLRSALSAQKVELDDRNPRVGDFSLATLVFDWVGCEAGVSRAARTVVPDADQDMPDEVDEVAPPQEQGRQRDGARRSGPPSATQPGPSTAPENELRELAIKGVSLILGADSAEAAVANREHSRKSKAAGYDVAPLLDGREVTIDNLGLAGRNKVFLAKLGAEVAAYWEQHGRSPVPQPVDAATVDAA